MPIVKLIPLNRVKLKPVDPLDDFEEIVAGAPSAAPIPAPSGEVGEVGKALKRGVPGAVAGLGRGLEFIGTELEELKPPTRKPMFGSVVLPEGKKVRLKGKEIAEKFGAKAAAPELAPSEEFLSQPWYSPKRLLATTVETAPLTIAAVGAGVLATIATKNPTVGTIVSGAIFGTTSAGAILKEAEEAGISRKEALKAARLAGAGEAALEFIPGMMFMRLVGGKQATKEVLKEGFRELRRVSRIARTAGKITLAESLEEGAQTAKDNLIARKFYDSGRELLADVPESTVVGGLLGFSLGGAGGVVNNIQRNRLLNKIKTDIAKLPENVLDSKAKAAALEDINTQQIEEIGVDLVPVKEKTPEAAAKDLGIKYNGLQEGAGAFPSMHLFTDNITGTTFGVENVVDTERRLAEKRKEFGLVEKKEEPVATVDLHAGIPLNKLVPKKWAPAWSEFWIPFSSVPNNKALLTSRYKQLGAVDKATRSINRVHDRLSKFDLDTRVEIFKYLDGQLSLLDLPIEARVSAGRIRDLQTAIGQKLVSKGILKEETFNKHKGNYVHYMFARHVIGDEGPIGIGSTGKLNLSYTIARNENMTDAQRKELGLIEDAAIAVPVGMGKALMDISKIDYLSVITSSSEWTWQPSIVEIEGQKMGIGKLVKEVEALEKTLTQFESPEIRERLGRFKTILDAAIEETKNVPKEFKQLPTDSHYGPLAGAFVRRAIADDIMPLFTSTLGLHRGAGAKFVLNVEAQGMALFKVSHVALNFPTGFRNVVSNIIQNNMRGRPLGKIPGDFINAVTSMKKKDINFIEARNHGLFRTNWSIAEIGELLDEFTKVDKGAWHTFLGALKNVAKFYGKIDDVAKHTIYVQMRKDGAPIGEAILEAQKWGMDYSLASRSVKEARRHIVPFISYQYKIAPLILESLRKNPLIIGKYLALPTLLVPTIIRRLREIDDDEWKKMQADLPRQLRKTGSPMLLPWQDPDGRWQWVNLEHYFPWGNWMSIFRDIGEADFSELARDSGIGNPMLDVVSALKSGVGGKPPKDPFSGIPIYNELDSELTKRVKLVIWLHNKWAPSMITNYGALGYTLNIGNKDKWGKTTTPSQAIGRWFGFNIKAIDERQSKAIKSWRIGELKREFRRIKNDPNIDAKTKREAAENLKRKAKEIIAGTD